MSRASSFPWTFGRSIENVSPTRSRGGGAGPKNALPPSPPPWGKGYLVLSADGDPIESLNTQLQDKLSLEAEPENPPPASPPHPTTPSPEERLKEQARLRRLEREREIAEAGEIDWVRSGGTLRDASGRRDVERTERIRAELRREAEEKRALARWAAYEARWQDFAASSGPVRFADIPWPVEETPKCAREITFRKIEDFLFADLAARGSTVTRKERIRTSMLRWHPDKMGPVAARVVEEDQADVKEGIGVVFRCLRALQDPKKAGRPSVPGANS